MSKPKTADEAIHKLPLDKVHVSVRNTRQPTVKEVTASGLVKSMKESGQITPGLVRPHPEKPGEYEIAAGSRRYVACEPAGLTEYRAVIKPMTDAEFDLVMLTENLQRENPDPRQEAIAVQRLIDQGLTLEAIGAAMGKDRKWVARRARLLHVIPAAMKAWDKGAMQHFTVEMMEYVGSLPEDAQKKLLNERDWELNRLKTRSNLHEHVKKQLMCSLEGVDWLEDPDTFVKGCGPGCSHDSSKQGDLFESEGKGKNKQSCGNCLNSSCFFARQGLANEKALKAATGGESMPVVTKRESYNAPAITIGKQTVKATSIGHGAKLLIHPPKDPKLAKKVTKAVSFDDGKPKIVWVQKADSSGSNSSKSDSKKLATPTEKIEAKQDQLQGKRWMHVMENLKAKLENSTWKDVELIPDSHLPCAKDSTPLYYMVAAFGLPWSRDNSVYYSASHWWKCVDTTSFETDHGNKRTSSYLECLWQGVKVILTKNFTHRLVTDILPLVPHMERVAKLLAWDIAEEKRQADLAIPAPKSWGPVDPHTLQPLTAGTLKTAAPQDAAPEPEAEPQPKAAKKKPAKAKKK